MDALRMAPELLGVVVTTTDHHNVVARGRFTAEMELQLVHDAQRSAALEAAEQLATDLWTDS